MIILGIDPGSRVTGFSVVEWGNGRPRVVELGFWRPSCRRWSCRIRELSEAVERWLQEYIPDAVALEEVFVHPRHPRPALVLQQITGVVEGALATHGFGWVTYPARTIKQTLTGSGAAAKPTLRRRLELMVPGLDEWNHLPADAFDALAVALCHGYRSGRPTPRHDHSPIDEASP